MSNVTNRLPMTPIQTIPNTLDHTPNVISGYNVNDVHQRGLATVYTKGVHLKTRNGSARSLPGPLISHYKHPQFRVLFDPRRDANPFFHLFESLWMIAGRNDVQGVSQFVPTMANYSDDGRTLNGAYGYRWRKNFSSWGKSGDQINAIVAELRSNPDSRRCVLQMWDTERDLLNQKSKDLCCNLLVKYRVLDGKLHAYVMNRSNDMVFGGYGANVFHFSFLQEYLADLIGVGVGSYEQISLDAHIYDSGVYGDKLWDNVQSMVMGALSDDQYRPQAASLPSFSLSPVLMRPHWYEGNGSVSTFAAENSKTTEQAEIFDVSFATDCNTLLDRDFSGSDGSGVFVTAYFPMVVYPMRRAYALFKAKRLEEAIDTLNSASRNLNVFITQKYEDLDGHFLGGVFLSKDPQPVVVRELDLFVAGRQWLQRRLDAQNAKKEV